MSRRTQHGEVGRGAGRLAARLLLLAFFVCVAGSQAAHAQLTIKTVTWDIIGLDSNNPAVGPNSFQVGSRVCNTSGAPLNNVVGNFVWDSSNIYVNLSGAATSRARLLAAGACVDFYYPVAVTRTIASLWFSSFGSGTSSTVTFLGRWKTAAFMPAGHCNP